MFRSTTKDFTSGSSLKQILGFMIPLFFGIAFQQLYGIVDTMIVGKTLGVNALAGVGATGDLNFFIVGFCTGTASGLAVPIAQKFGEKDFAGLRRFAGNAIWISVVFSLLMGILTVVFCADILKLMNTPDEMFSYSYAYIVVIFAGIPITVAYNVLAGIIRSLGDSRSPVIFLMIAGVINVGLDLLFIITFGIGAFGAALATVVSQLISALLCFILILRRFDFLRLSREELRPDVRTIGTLCGIAFPMGFMSSITAIGSLMLQVATNGLGAVCVAAKSTAGKIMAIFYSPFDAMGITMGTFAGQNFGAGRIDRIRKGYKENCVIGMIYSVIALLVVFFFGKYIVYLFVDVPTEELVSLTQQRLLTESLAYIFLMFLIITRYLLQGMGHTKLAMASGMAQMGARVFGALFLVPALGYTGICLSGPLAWGAGALVVLVSYFCIMRKIKRQETLSASK